MQDDIITISEDCYEPRSEVVKHDHATPPNSAPLPAKFGNSSLGLVHHPGAMQGNLLRVQLQKKSLMDCDTSSAASTTNEVPFSPTIQACQSGSKTTVSELQAQKHQRHQPSSGDTHDKMHPPLVICNLSSYFCSNFHILNNLF